jgi:hypothetical protein
MEFKLEENNTLKMLRYDKWVKVELQNCFPRTKPNSFYSIRDEKKVELELLEDFYKLDDRNKAIMKKYLAKRNFVFTIVGIYNISEEFGIRHWEVMTTEGKRLFQTELELWPEELQAGGIIIRDIYSDQYKIESLKFGSDFLARYV